MKFNLPFLALALLASPVIAQPKNSPPNLIKNGDFELDSPATPPPGWLIWGATKDRNPLDAARDTTQAHSGKASYRLHHSANTGAFTITDRADNLISSKKGATYEWSFWAKTDVPGLSQIAINAFSQLVPLKMVPAIYTKQVEVGTEWKQFTFKTVEGANFSADTARYLALTINPTLFGPTSPEKTMWIDDVVVTEVGVTSINTTTFIAPAATTFKLSPLFSDGMVLQRAMPIPVWGEAAAGQKISATLNGKTASTTADAAGKWMLRLPAMEAGGPFAVQVQPEQGPAIALKDVLVGDVWLASGQSNMEWPLRSAVNGAQEVASANDSQLRFFTVKKTSTDTPQTSVSGSWQETNARTSPNFSAVGYFFARELRRELKVPIGIIHSSWGGSSAQAWTKREVLQSEPEFKLLLDAWQKTVEAYPAAKADYDVKLAAWQIEADKAKAGGLAVPANKPGEPQGPTFPLRPSALYNGMLAPLMPYAIKGTIWYQGETNSGQPALYRKLFPSLINSWRADWKQGDTPFLFVQLPNIGKPQTAPVETPSWADFREAQAVALQLPNTAMINTIDIGEAKTVHPLNKQEVGRRMALVALHKVYGQKVVDSGPLYSSMEVEGNKVRVRFKSAEGLKTKGDKLTGFAIAGADKNWVWAEAQIDGSSVVLSNKAISSPVAVRYNWAQNPIGNLVNGAGLPAFSFRTDTSSPTKVAANTPAVASATWGTAPITQPLTVGTARVAQWKDDKKSAFMLMFDDSIPSAFKVVIPELQKRNMVATFYINPGQDHYQKNIDKWEKEIPTFPGMAYGNHTMAHLGYADGATAEADLAAVNAVIYKAFPGKEPRLVSFGRPGVPKAKWTVSEEDFKKALAKNNLIERPNFWQHGAMYDPVKTSDDMLKLVDKGLAAGTAEYLIFHGVGGDWVVTPTEMFTTFLDGLAAKRDQIWITDHISAHKYETERKSAKLTVAQSSDKQIQLELKSEADPTLYDLPLTLVAQVSATWKRCQVVQGATKTMVTSVDGRVQFEALPGGGSITIQPA